MNWFAETRIAWIGETLQIFGFIQRQHLQRKFRVSKPQATNDLREFQDRFPDRMSYDRSRKMYVARDGEILTHVRNIDPAAKSDEA